MSENRLCANDAGRRAGDARSEYYMRKQIVAKKQMLCQNYGGKEKQDVRFDFSQQHIIRVARQGGGGGEKSRQVE